MIGQRLQRRLMRHHLPLALLSLASGSLLYLAKRSPDVITNLSFASAWPGLVLLALTLLIGPFKQLWGQKAAISLDFRRDTGIWAGLVGIFHAVIGQCVHLRGRPWLYYIYQNWRKGHAQPFRHDIFGLANYTGLVAAILLLMLLATSNDASLRVLGAAGWKNLQRWNYAIFVFSILHTFAYQLGVERPIAALVALAVTAAVMTVTLQVIGYRRRRQGA